MSKRGTNTEHFYTSRVTYCSEFNTKGPIEGFYFENKTAGESSPAESILADLCDENTRQHCLKIKGCGAHKNLMAILEIDERGVDGSRVLYAYHDQSTLSSALDSNLVNHATSIETLQLYASHLVRGLDWLHKNSLYHGNLSLDTTHLMMKRKSLKELRPGNIKLGQFKAHPNATLEEMIKRDHAQLGKILKKLFVKACISEEEEIKKVRRLLKDGDCPMLYMPVLVLRNPMFLSENERPLFFTEAVRYMIDLKVEITCDASQLRRRPPGVNFRNDDLEEYKLANESDADTLWSQLNLVRAIPGQAYSVVNRYGVVHHFRFSVVHRMAVTAKNLINHYKDNDQNAVLGGIIGKTPARIMKHFCGVQPELVYIVYIAATRNGFKYSRFQGHLHCDEGILP